MAIGTDIYNDLNEFSDLAGQTYFQHMANRTIRPLEEFPAIQRAVDFIRGKIDAAVWRPGETIPSVRTLSLSAGVSRYTMIKAVALLKKEGCIVTVERGGMRVAGPIPDDEGVTGENLEFWGQVRRALEQDILSGAFAQKGNLPNIKELQTRYGVCFRTMQKVVRSLVTDHVLVRRGKKLFEPGSSGPAYRQSIVFITHRTDSAQISAINHEHKRIVDILEDNCVRFGLALETVDVDFYNSGDVRRAVARLTGNRQAMGYVLDLWWYLGESFRQSYLDVLSALALEKKPAALLDELGSFALPHAFSGNPLVQVFRIEGSKAGERMAGFLLGQGHRSVVYLSSDHGQSWSQDRLTGLQTRFAKAGFPDAVQPIVIGNLSHLLLQVFYASRLKDDLIRKIFAATGTERQTREQFEAWLDFKENPEQILIDEKHAPLFRRNLACFKQLAKQSLKNDLFRDLSAATLKRAYGWALDIVLEPLFKKAILCRNSTAWICASDGIARSALEFVRGREISVPRVLSIAGFDNEPVLTTEAKLTTYDFNANGFVHRMLNFIARPPRPRGPYRHAVIEVEGMVVERGTTGRAI
jgi:DNA-binding transcriptional regulator YhcF (GntR family)